MKKMIRLRWMLLIASAVVAGVAAGCSEGYEDLPTPGVTPDVTPPDGEYFEAQFSFGVEEIASATGEVNAGDANAGEAGAGEAGDATRTVSSYDSKIDNLWILQYDATGARVHGKYLSSSSAVASVSILKIYYPATSVIFLANVGSSFGTSSSAATLSALGSASKTIYGHDGVLQDRKYCIMSKTLSTSAVKFTSVNQITLHRNAAKVFVEINSTMWSTWSIHNIETLNIQKKSYYYPGDYTSKSTFPASSSTVDYTWGYSEKSSALGSGYTFYLPINRRGIKNSNHTSSDKSKYPLADATAIRVSMHSTTEPLYQAIYTFYLGSNTTTDYNLNGNKYYDCTYTIRSTGSGDGRVEVNYKYYTNSYNAYPVFKFSFDAPGTYTYSYALGKYPRTGNNSQLPNKKELMMMYIFKVSSDNFKSSKYWAYSDTTGKPYWAVNFSTGQMGFESSGSPSYYVRPVAYFTD